MRTGSVVPAFVLAFLPPVSRNLSAVAAACAARAARQVTDWWTVVWDTIAGWSLWSKVLLGALLLSGLAWLLKAVWEWLGGLGRGNANASAPAPPAVPSSQAGETRAGGEGTASQRQKRPTG